MTPRSWPVARSQWNYGTLYFAKSKPLQVIRILPAARNIPKILDLKEENTGLRGTKGGRNVSRP
jgi:hypothetical protein